MRMVAYEGRTRGGWAMPEGQGVWSIEVFHASAILDMVAGSALGDKRANELAHKPTLCCTCDTAFTAASKGDGFIWIKRKHYFQPELKQSFILNYLRSGHERRQQ